MKKVLNQEEIDALVKASRQPAGSALAPGGGETQTAVTVCDFRHAGHIDQEQVRAVSALHENFARNLSHSLAAYLRVLFEATLVSAEHLPYREFLSRLPEVSYLASCVLEPMQVSSLLELDLTVAFPIIDLLLGGQGRGGAPEREVTEIEEQLLEGVVRIICRELQNAWQPLGLGFHFGQRQQNENVVRLIPQQERILGLSFEVTVGEVRGLLNLAVPVAVSGALLRKLARDSVSQKPVGMMQDDRLKKRVRDCEFLLELVLPPAGVAVRELLQLSSGQILTLPLRLEIPAVLRAGEKDIFSARAVRVGEQRAAHVLQPLSPPLHACNDDHPERSKA